MSFLTSRVAKSRKQPVRDWLIIRLAVLSGLRASEISSLKATDLYIGYSRSEIVVRNGKGGKQRVVKIGRELKRDLRWYLKWKAENGELHPEAYVLRSQRVVFGEHSRRYSTRSVKPQKVELVPRLFYLVKPDNRFNCLALGEVIIERRK